MISEQAEIACARCADCHPDYGWVIAFTALMFFILTVLFRALRDVEDTLKHLSNIVDNKLQHWEAGEGEPE